MPRPGGRGAAVILAAGAAGQRTVGPVSTVVIVPISSDDRGAEAAELDRAGWRLSELLAESTGQPPDRVAADMAVGREFTPDAAAAYGLADRIAGPEVAPQPEAVAPGGRVAGLTEADWLRSDDAGALLQCFLAFGKMRPGWRGRKDRLVAVAFCRRVQGLLADPDSRSNQRSL